MPSVGDSVWFFTKEPSEQMGTGQGPYAAIITKLISETAVCLKIFPPDGTSCRSRTVDNDPNDTEWWEPRL